MAGALDRPRRRGCRASCSLIAASGFMAISSSKRPVRSRVSLPAPAARSMTTGLPLQMQLADERVDCVGRIARAAVLELLRGVAERCCELLIAYSACSVAVRSLRPGPRTSGCSPSRRVGEATRTRSRAGRGWPGARGLAGRGAILARRGLRDLEEARRFLAAEESPDPLTLPGVPRPVS